MSSKVMKIVGLESYFLATCMKISKEKNKNSISSELSKIAILPKNVV